MRVITICNTLKMSSEFHFSKDEKGAVKQTFFKLKPVCDQIAVLPTVKSATELKSVLENLPSESLQLFDHYILVPIFLHLSNSNKHKSDSISILLQCLNVVLKHIKIQDINLFLKILVLIFSQVLDEKESNKLSSSSSEELKLGVMKCAKTLIKRSEPKVLSAFYSRQNYGKLSMSVYTCTRIATSEESIHLKEQTLKTLIFLTHVQNLNNDSHALRQQVANVVMLMLPGLVSFSLSVATATDIQNHKITLLAIRLWSRVAGLVMDDNIHTDDGERKTASKKFSLVKPLSRKLNLEFSTKKTSQDSIQGVTRSRTWIENSNEHLLPVTKAFAGLQCHHHWKVRLELVNAAHHVLTYAPKNLCFSVPTLIEILIILSQDEQPEVCAASLEAIHLFSEGCELKSDAKNLIEIVEDSLYELISKLPRIICGVDLTLKERQLSLVSGYLDILGHAHLGSVLSSAQHVHRLLSCILMAATLDCTSVSLLEEVSLRNLEKENSSSRNVWRKLKWCNSHKSQLRIKQICRKLVKYSNLSLFVHHLLDNFHSERSRSKEITLIFIYIFSSGKASDHDEIETALNVFDALMDQNLWNLPVSVSINTGVTKEEARNNIVQICLLMEAVSSLASFLGSDVFSPLLLRCLYPLLENAGSPLHLIAFTGLKSIKRIAVFYGGGVSELVTNNVDYLSHHVLLHLRRVRRNPKVLSVLSVIMEHSTLTVLPSLLEIINDVLVQCFDFFQDENASAFLQVFLTFVVCLNKWCAEVETPEDMVNKEVNIIEELLDYQRIKQEAEKLSDDESELQDFIEEDIFPNVNAIKKKDDPRHIKLTVQILNTSLHFLSSKDNTRQIVVLQILENGLLLLRTWTDELLPIVHKIWSPLAQRFRYCDNHLIAQRAFSLLKTMGNLAKEFIRVRTLSDVFPYLLDTLKSTSKDSLKCDSAAYKMSQKYKLQLCLLAGIGELSLDMDLTEKEIDNILDAITPYLSCRQPRTLQDACLYTFKLIGKEFSDLVWLHLMSISPKKLQFEAPCTVFTSYKILVGV
ncbi:telo2 interacting protein 1 isoform X3 [Rhodnius prolixus]|uniref:telo2 interacting protein 1 isoform X3 n=1 Tax=Rhodnius prolixus TaxID=13249 RepID=UPI003D18D160